MPKLIVAEAVERTTKTKKPYLNVKSSTGNFYSIWEEQRYIWHLFVPQAELEVTVATNGAFTNITGVEGIVEPNKSGGTTLYKTEKVNAMDWLVEKIKKMEKDIDWLVNEQKTLNSLKGQDLSGDVAGGNIKSIYDPNLTKMPLSEELPDLNNPLT